MNNLSTNDTKKKANKVAIRFVVLLVGLYLLFSQGNIFMNSVMSEGGRFYNPYIAEHFNYIQWIKSALIIPGTWLIKLFGFYAVHNEMDIMVVDGPYLRVNYSCVGLGVMSFFTAFIIAFPAKLKPKLKLFVIGTIMIYLLNVSRIAGLGILLGFFFNPNETILLITTKYLILSYIYVFSPSFIFGSRKTLKQPSLNQSITLNVYTGN